MIYLIYIDRIGMENDLPNSVDIERELDINHMQVNRSIKFIQ